MKSNNVALQNTNCEHNQHIITNPKVAASKGRPHQKRIRRVNEMYQSRKNDLSKQRRGKKSKVYPK